MSSNIVSLIILFFCLSAQAKTIEVEKVLTVVNDRAILKSDLERTAKTLSGDSLVDETLLQLYDRVDLTKNQDKMTQYLIDEAIVDSEVKRKGLDVTIERVDQEIRNILKGKNITRPQLRDALAAKGVSMTEYQAFIKKSIERRSLIDREISSRIKISDEDVAVFYTRMSTKKDSQTFDYDLAHILFLTKNGGEAAAKERALMTHKKLVSGKSFEELAKQNSEADYVEGGLLGSFKSGEMLREIEVGVKDLNVGEFSQPVKTKMGIHIFKVIKKNRIADPELDEKREQIRAQLFGEAFKRQFRIWLDQKRATAFILVNK